MAGEGLVHLMGLRAQPTRRLILPARKAPDFERPSSTMNPTSPRTTAANWPKCAAHDLTDQAVVLRLLKAVHWDRGDFLNARKA